MTALILIAFVVGLLVGVATGYPVGVIAGIGHRTADPGSLRHTIDHRCEPPFCEWSGTNDDLCFVHWAAYGKKIKPGDVWVCPCLKTWVAHDGKWIEAPAELKDGVT